MGRDVSKVGNHDLNIKSIELLANDLANRLNINISYGFFNVPTYAELLNLKKTEDSYFQLGVIHKNKSDKLYYLQEEGYQERLLYKKFGDKLFYMPQYYYYNKPDDSLPDEKYIESIKKDIQSLYYNLEIIGVSDENDLDITISHSQYQCHSYYYSRWWTFCNFFTDYQYIDTEALQELNQFRTKLLKLNLILGGTHMYYLDDQSEVLDGEGEDVCIDFNWKQFETFVKQKTEHLMLNVSDFLTDENYRTKFLLQKKNPLSFIDNFKDLF